MENIVVLHRSELEEIIHTSIMNALREIKEEEAGSDSEFYTRKQVAAKWHVGEITVWRQEKLGYIHCVRRGRRVLYRKDEIDNYQPKRRPHRMAACP